MKSITAMVVAAGIAAGMVLGSADFVSAQESLSVPVAGTGSAGARLTGKLSVLRFEARESNTKIVAIAMVQGVVERGNRAVGSVVQGPFEVPVRVGTSASAGAAVRGGFRPAVGGTDMSLEGRVMLVQTTCPVLNLELGPVTLDLLGLQISLSPVTLNLSGAAGAPLGELVCQASQLLTNVVALVGVLNDILGVLTGLLGGITGGLGTTPPTT